MKLKVLSLHLLLYFITGYFLFTASCGIGIEGIITRVLAQISLSSLFLTAS